MLIYEKDNKLNISFENNMDETDIVVGKDEVKIGDSTISDSNVLPVATEEDVGKVPTVQEDGSYALENAGGGGSEPFVVTFSGTTADGDAACDKTWAEISAAYAAGKSITARHIFMEVGDEVADWYIHYMNVAIHLLINEPDINFASPFAATSIYWNGSVNKYIYASIDSAGAVSVVTGNV